MTSPLNDFPVSTVTANGKEYRLVHNMRFVMLADKYAVNRASEGDDLDVDLILSETMEMLKAGMKPYHAPEEAEELFDVLPFVQLTEFLALPSLTDNDTPEETGQEEETQEETEETDFLETQSEN